MAPHRVPAAWIAPPVLAVLTLPAVVALAAGSPASTSTAVVRPSWSAPVAMRTCAGPDSPGRAALGAGLAGRARTATDPLAEPAWMLRPALDAKGTLQGWTLTTTARHAATAELRLPPEAAVRGPVAGSLAVAADDGSASTIALVSPRDGCAEIVHGDAQVVRQAIVRPGTGDILFHSVRRTDRADLGVHVLAAGGPPAQILAPLLATDPALSAIGRVWSTRLLLAHGGTLLAVQSCGEASCLSRLVDLGSGQARWLPGDADGHLVGLDGATAVVFDACPGLPCPLLAVDLARGERRLLSPAALSAITAVVEDRLLAVVTEEAHGSAEAVAIDPADGGRRHLAVDARDLSFLPGLAATAGIEPRAGWIAAVDERDGTPLAIDLPSLLAAATEVSR